MFVTIQNMYSSKYTCFKCSLQVKPLNVLAVPEATLSGPAPVQTNIHPPRMMKYRKQLSASVTPIVPTVVRKNQSLEVRKLNRCLYCT